MKKQWVKNNRISENAVKKYAIFGLLILLQAAIAISTFLNPQNQLIGISLMFLPILIAGLILGQWAGAFFGLLGAIFLGQSFISNEAPVFPWQSIHWMIISGILTFTGFFSGYLSSRSLGFSYQNTKVMEIDPYTGIRDRKSFFQRIDAGLKRGETHSVALIEIKNKDKITSLLGYDVYDDLVERLLDILRENLPASVPLFSLEIGILGVSAGEEIDQYASNIVSIFENPVKSMGIPIVCELIIGIASGPRDGKNADELVKNALSALEESRKTIQPISHFSEIKQPSMIILPLICQLNEAIESGQIDFHYQPIVDSHTCAPISLEALLRWHHPEYGTIPPQDFIFSLESTTFINRLTYWVVEENSKRLAELHADFPDLNLAINISVANLQRESFSRQIEKILVQNHIPPDLFTFEITEHGLLTEYKEILHNLAHLHEMGIQISIDDFGTGNTTIETMSRVHIDSIKMDKIFFNHFLSDKINQKIVSGIISIDQNLNIKTIAEGIEDQQTAQLLENMGVDYQQGFFYSKPKSYGEIRSWLQKQELPLK